MVLHSVAVEIVVNGVLRTLWVSSRMQNQLREAQALMTIPQRATHAPCETLMGINGFGGQREKTSVQSTLKKLIMRVL